MAGVQVKSSCLRKKVLTLSVGRSQSHCRDGAFHYLGSLLLHVTHISSKMLYTSLHYQFWGRAPHRAASHLPMSIASMTMKFCHVLSHLVQRTKWGTSACKEVFLLLPPSNYTILHEHSSVNALQISSCQSMPWSTLGFLFCIRTGRTQWAAWIFQGFKTSRSIWNREI